jgi:hypothetical protein
MLYVEYREFAAAHLVVNTDLHLYFSVQRSIPQASRGVIVPAQRRTTPSVSARPRRISRSVANARYREFPQPDQRRPAPKITTTNRLMLPYPCVSFKGADRTYTAPMEQRDYR